MTAYFDRFAITMTLAEAESCSHPGPCDDDIRAMIDPSTSRGVKMRKQLDKITCDDIRAELAEYGAWDADELADDSSNHLRIVWIAAGNITHPNG